MSIFLGAGKLCQLCFDAKDDPGLKQRCQSDMFVTIKMAMSDSDEKYDREEIDEECLNNDEILANELRILCFNCDGSDCYVYEKVKDTIADPLKKNMADARNDIEVEKKAKFKEKGVEIQGNVYKVSFGAKR